MMSDLVWDHDLRAVLSSLLRSAKHDSRNVDEVVALAVQYAQALSKRRIERQAIERGLRDRKR
jgi:hypothetical protein